MVSAPVTSARLLSRALASVALVVASTGCHPSGRGANGIVVSGVQILSSTGSRDADAGVTGLLSLQGGTEFVDDDSPFAGSVRAAAAFGGNADGPAGRARFEASVGVAPGSLHAVHARLGLASFVEASPYNGFRYFELPSFATGYTFHGQSDERYSDSMHFHVGPRVALALAGGVDDGDHGFNFGVAPDLGGEVVFAGEASWLEGRYRAFVGATRLDVIETMGCLAFVLAACVETRHMMLPDVGGRPRSTSYVGFTLGFGLASGMEWSSWW